MSFAGSIDNYHREVRCEIARFAVAVPIERRLADKDRLQAGTLLSLTSERGGVSIRDCTLDAFIEHMRSAAFDVLYLITDSNWRTGVLQFEDGPCSPEDFASYLATVPTPRLLDMSCCWSHRLISLMQERDDLAVEVVRISDQPLDRRAAMFFCEALVRVMHSQPGRNYRDLVLAVFDSLPCVLKSLLARNDPGRRPA